jgi:hypothetical protein
MIGLGDLDAVAVRGAEQDARVVALFEDGEYNDGYVYNPRDGDTYRFEAKIIDRNARDPRLHRHPAARPESDLEARASQALR